MKKTINKTTLKNKELIKKDSKADSIVREKFKKVMKENESPRNR